MTSNTLIIENPSTTNGKIISSNNKLSELYAAYKTNSPRSPSLSSIHSFSSSSSSDSSNKDNRSLAVTKTNSSSMLSTSQRKESALKLPYPVLSDHRDPSSILVLLEKENQMTSKKISDVIKQIEDCEQRLTSNIYTDNEKKTFKYERVKLKQQLDALKKHERRVNLQIDFMTTKTEIKGLEDKQKQIDTNENSDEIQQIKILLGKLRQKLDKMKIYMRTRNEQMKKLINSKSNLNNHRQQHLLSTSAKDMTQKRPSTSLHNGTANKRSKPALPNIRLASRITGVDSKKNTTPSPIVRFVNKTTESTNNSASPATPASSASTFSSPLTASTSLGDINLTANVLQRNERSSVDNDNDDELDLELDMDELFNDDSCSQSTISRLKVDMKDVPHQIQVKQNT